MTVPQRQSKVNDCDLLRVAVSVKTFDHNIIGPKVAVGDILSVKVLMVKWLSKSPSNIRGGEQLTSKALQI